MAKEDQEITLHLLNEIEQDGGSSQRLLSMRLGIAVGLTNAYIRRCVQKGWIRISKVPPRRYLYFITPKGFMEKSRLTARYLESSFNFFRQARTECLQIFRDAKAKGWHRLVLFGDGDLAEIAGLAAQETGANILGVVAPDNHRQQVAGQKVLQRLPKREHFDAVMITDIHNPRAVYEKLMEHVEEARILAPDLLMITRAESAPGHSE